MGLVLGVDDFAIKKDTRTIPAFTIFGAKRCWIYSLAASSKICVPMLASIPTFLALNPKGVVMDLAQAYHTWISECFPSAVRRSVQQTLSSRAKAILKSHHRNRGKAPQSHCGLPAEGLLYS